MKRKTITNPLSKTVLKGCFLLFLALFSTSLSAQITVDVSNKSIKEILKEIETKSEYRFFYNESLKGLDKITSLRVKDATIDKTMLILLEKTEINYKLEKKNLIVLVAKTRIIQSESKKITGLVTDEKGDPIIGATIIEIGTNKGTVTDINGQFSLETANAGQLKVSYIGYENQIVSISGKNMLKISLSQASNDLEEVVVVGYGSMKKSDLTGAVSTVKASDISKSSTVSVSNMLSGKAAGVTVTQNSAQPGGGIEILIRGGASTGAGNDPLYIIDGFPVGGNSIEPGSNNRYSDFGSRNPLNSINPNDIESIEILKDASSTAIYGARAANGVVIITTKKGKEGKPIVNYTASYGMQQISKKMDMLNATEFMTEANNFSKEKWLFDNNISPYGSTNPNTVKKWIAPYSESKIADAGIGTDWYGLIIREGTINQHNISVTGGVGQLKYLASLNYFNQKGVVKNSDLTRYSGRINIEHELSSIFTYGVNLSQSFIHSTNIPLGNQDFENSGLINSALTYDPTVKVKDDNGNYIVSPLMSTVPNPVSMLEITDFTDSKRMLVSSFLQAELSKGLFVKVNLGFDNQTGQRNVYLPKSTLYGKQTGGSANISFVNQFDKLLEATINYNFDIQKTHRFNLLGGYSYQNFISDGFSAANSQFFTDAFLYNSLGSGETKRPEVGSFKSKDKFQSFFGRINYNLLEKYIFTFTTRVDGSTKFGANNRYGMFPSGAVAWRINQEDFLKNTNIFSDLKLRLSFGQTGNSNIGNNAFEYYSSAWHQYVFGDAVNTGTYKSQLANPELKWETTTEANIGVDFGFFNQRLSGSFEYYNKEVKDLLGFRALKSYMELSRVAANIGKTQSSGLELTLRSNNFTGQFKWDTEFTFTHYESRWKERNPNLVLNPWEKNDAPLRAYYGYQSDGLLQIGETPPASMPVLMPGQFKIKDLNGFLRDGFGNLIMDSNGKVQYLNQPDGKIDQADIVMLGTTDPGFSIGLGNTFKYKNFDLNIFFYGMFNRIVNNATRGKFSVSNMRFILNGQNFMTEVADRWSSINPTGKLPSGFVSVYPQPSDYLQEDASFLRCKNITLGYILPTKIIRGVFSKARIFADLGNPFVITNYTGQDPETDFKAGYPNQRSFMFGVDVTF